MKDKFPNSHIIAADNSEDMLKKAVELYPYIEFIKLDANGDLNEISDKFDIVFSNACIQWLPNHRELLPKMMTLLKPNGILAIQIPMQQEHNNLKTDEYFDVLSDISNSFEIWETTYCHRMPSYESIIEWYKGTGLRPYLEQLSESEANEFIDDVYIELQQRYQVQKNGEILFRFPRLFFMVKNNY